jgi:hypothetical protein
MQGAKGDEGQKALVRASPLVGRGVRRRFEHAAARAPSHTTPFQSELTPKFSIIINAKAASGRVIYHMMLSEKRHSTAIRPKWSRGRVFCFFGCAGGQLFPTKSYHATQSGQIKSGSIFFAV